MGYFFYRNVLPRGRGGMLVDDRNVGGLKTLGAFFDRKLNLLTFGQVAKPITLDGRKMHKYIRSAFAGDEPETFFAVEPLDCALNTITHNICLLGHEKNVLGVLFVPSEDKKNNNPQKNREPPLFIQPMRTYCYPRL